MPSEYKPIVIADLRGGRNGGDVPLALLPDQCVEALNVDWFDGLLARKRGGCDSVALTGGTAFANGIYSLIRHIPGAAESAAELWGVDGAGLIKVLKGGTSWANVTLADAIASHGQDILGATLNGKLFLAYDTAVDRLHVWDPNLGLVRRMGLQPGANPPTVANQGAGAYAAVIRYYRVRWVDNTTGIFMRGSEPTPVATFTPSGAGAAARITKPATVSESETIWQIEASTDNVTFYFLTQLVVGTTFYDDTAAPSTYSTNPVSDPIGTYALMPSVKYVLSDGNRLLGAGSWEGVKNSRVYFTPVLGSLDRGDDERVPNTTTQKNWVDLNENDGGAITGLGGPLNSVPFASKYRQLWRLIPTGDVSAPYLPRQVTNEIGNIRQQCFVRAPDEAGAPCLYFLNPDTGPYRYGRNGLQNLGRDVEDIWATINLSTSVNAVAHGIYFPKLKQVWWWIATGSSVWPDVKIVFDVRLGRVLDGDEVRKGWAKHTGDSASAACSCVFANTLGASMSQDLRPYLGRPTAVAVLKCESTATDDAGTTFQAYVKSKPLAAAPLGQNVAIGQSQLLAKVASGVTITQTLDRDYGLETRTSTVVLTAAAAETRVLRKFEGSDLAGAGTVQVQLGDSAAVSNGWVLDAVAIPVLPQEVR